MTLIIQVAQKQDTEIIAQFQEKMAWETENLKLDPQTVNKGVQAVFDNPEKGQYFVAKNELNQIIASLLTTYEWSDWRNQTIWWIQSVFVLPEFRKKGIFKQMYWHIKSLAQADLEVGGIRLYVDKTNASAQGVYNKVGMNGEHYQLFEWLK